MKQVTSKQATPKTPAPAVTEKAVPKDTNRILKIASCPSTSGKSTLTYHIGCTVSSDIMFRVYANSGGGFFSQEWVSLKDIQKAFEKGPKPITSFALINLFRGKSVNTPAFLLAALKNEGLLKADAEKQRCHECIDPAGFIAEVNKLIASSIALKVEGKPREATPSKEIAATAKGNKS